MPLTAEEAERIQNKYKEFIEFYVKTRRIVIASERIAQEQRICITAVIEMRSAFEHIMRAHGVLEGVILEKEIDKGTMSTYDYCEKNIEKAHAHLYRAAYDAYDVIAIATSLRIEKNIDSVSRETLYAVCSTALNEIVLPFREAQDLVTIAKTKKDIGTKDQEEREFSDYEKAASSLLNVNDKVEKIMPELIKYETSSKKRERKSKVN